MVQVKLSVTTDEYRPKQLEPSAEHAPQSSTKGSLLDVEKAAEPAQTSSTGHAAQSSTKGPLIEAEKAVGQISAHAAQSSTELDGPSKAKLVIATGVVYLAKPKHYKPKDKGHLVRLSESKSTFTGTRLLLT